jgi:MFS family permease
MAATAHLFLAANDGPEADRKVSGRAWLVFALSFGLLLSDYMSRQVLAAVFPLLKADWALSDGQLGALAGAVALSVGVLTVPLSWLADRIGRVRCVAAMAVTWSLATLACGLCASYGQMLAARLVLGAGEAAYGSVGLAVVFTYFPRTLRGTITSAFMAGGLAGSFIGLALGGAAAERLGWRGAFVVMAVLGLSLALAYLAIVREVRTAPRGSDPAAERTSGGASLSEAVRALFGSAPLVLTYVGSGLQLFVLGALITWTPSLLHRAIGLSPRAAALAAAALLLASGIGMVVCGGLSDRLSANRPALRPWFAVAFGLVTVLALEAALAAPFGPAQAIAALIGLFVAGGTTGPAGALVAEATPPRFHGAALAVLTLANNLLGLAPGPAFTGRLADRIGLHAALQVSVLAALFAAVAFALVARLQTSTTDTGR